MVGTKAVTDQENDEISERKIAGFILSSESAMAIVKSLTRADRRFSDLQKELQMTSGRLNYHLLRMRSFGILSRRRSREGYGLTKKGKRVAEKYF